MLAWNIPWTEEPGRLQSIGSQKARINWVSTHRAQSCCPMGHSKHSVNAYCHAKPHPLHMTHTWYVCPNSSLISFCVLLPWSDGAHSVPSVETLLLFKKNLIKVVVSPTYSPMLSHVQLFAAPWAVAHWASLSMEFSRQEYWSGLPFPSPGYLPDPGIKHRSPILQADSLPSEQPGKPNTLMLHL